MKYTVSCTQTIEAYNKQEVLAEFELNLQLGIYNSDNFECELEVEE